jgi:ATP-dependent exoDNAse (exonuclease V) beta subunit
MTADVTLADRDDRALIRGEDDPGALDQTIVVEAAAGTGKTTELVTRIVRVLATGRAAIHEVAAVTFTEKAAGELKLRLRGAVEVARTAAIGEAARHLDAALRQLENAHVTTIHGFCAELLRERPVEAGIDPLFRVLTETQATRIFNGVFDLWLQDQLADPPEGVRRILRRRAWPSDEEGSIEGLRKAGLELSEWRDFDGEWTRPAFDRRARVDELAAEIVAVGDLLKDPASKYDALHQSTRPIWTLAEHVVRGESLSARDYDGLEAQFVSLARDRELSKLRKGTGTQYRPGVARDAVWQAVERARASLAAFEMEANADLAALLRTDLRELIERYARAKTEAGVVDFLDLLLKARDLIVGHREARESFQRRFARIFVDEFQDTDPLQAEILMLLAADDPGVTDWQSVRPVPGKLFLVGDPKQSIYRFRRADVGVYQRVYARLVDVGARRVTLRSSFRARPNVQRTINAAFAPAMTGDALSQQAHYVGLEPTRAELIEQPSVVVLPVPEPYATQRIANSSIDRSLPDAVGAFVDWLIHDSGWQIDVRGSLEPIAAGHICVLFRRFVSYDVDVTRPYVEALEARGIPHLLVGGRSFHNRAEVEALRAALAAVERPGDELSVFAALRGPFFGIDDDTLLRYRARFRRFHPFRVPVELGAGAPAGDDVRSLRPVAEALELLRDLHGRRNRVPVAATITALFEATRVHVRFALEHSGEQVLANVLRIADLARQFEAEGGMSFRGFLEELDAQAETGRVEEAPILEEGSDGVRLMTVHKAKGLEFPVVILADMTAKLRPAAAARYLDADRRLCAVRLAGCAPDDLTRQGLLELERDAAEGVRVAYVAATRARDLLVIPAVGDEERDGWLDTLNAAIYPPLPKRRSPADGLKDDAGAPIVMTRCPSFRSRDSVVNRPHGDPAAPATVSPGLHDFGGHHVVWWDPHALKLGISAPGGLRYADLIAKKDVAPGVIASGLERYEAWRVGRQRAIASGARPTIAVQQVTQRAGGAAPAAVRDVEVLHVGAPRLHRGRGRRFGTLVHSVLAAVPLDADAVAIAALAASQARLLEASDEEVAAAAECVGTALAHPLMHRARVAASQARCRREAPVIYRSDDEVLLEGTIDLAFEDDAGWTVVDFKTDAASQADHTRHRRQISHYMIAVERAMNRPVAGVLLYL